MVVRSIFICSYLVAVYWLSHHYPTMKMAFYPTLGAFCFLFMKHGGQVQHTARVIVGATVASAVGSLLYLMDSGALSFFITSLVTITLIHVCRWNAAPILSVSLIPYFTHPAAFWILPLAVLVSLSGLLLPVWVIDRLERFGWLHALETALFRPSRGTLRGKTEG